MSIKQLRYALKKGLAGLAKGADGKFLKEGREGSTKVDRGSPAAPTGKEVRADTLELTDADFHATPLAGAIRVQKQQTLRFSHRSN